MERQSDTSGGFEARVGRRDLLKAGFAIGGGAAALGAMVPAAAAARPGGLGRTRIHSTDGGGVVDQGVGTYTDASVAFQISNFSINQTMVSCGVGTIGLPPSFSGPFAMLMFAHEVATYELDRAARTIRATGTMRSITEMADITVEDVVHEFLATASDGDPDRFAVHFTTPFWNRGNPMATPSDEGPDLVRFGGALLLGEIVVAP